MSTKINVRSPFYLNLTEPTVALGEFTCAIADLQNFAVASSGAITIPTTRYGLIIDQTATSFPQNTTGSPISRSVTYTIEIPEGYTNVGDATIDCTVTTNQPSLEPQQDPTQNDNCPTFNGTISDSSGSSSYAVSLGSFFTAGSTASISSYKIVQTGDAAVTYSLTGTVPNQTLTVSSTSSCVTADFYVVAKNSNDACVAYSNTFNFAAPCSEAFDCTDVNLTGGSILQDGTVNKSSFSLGTLNTLLDGATDITTSLNVGENTTGSDRDITLTYRMNIPQGYTNSGTIDCDKTYTQPATDVLPAWSCTDSQIEGVFISKDGNIAAPTSLNGTLESWSPQNFPLVDVDTTRSITFTITIPSGYSNAGVETTCTNNYVQPARTVICGTLDFFISKTGFAAAESFCTSGDVYSINIPVKTNASTFFDIRSTLGQRICRDGSPFRGGNLYYAYAENATSSGAGAIGATFYLLKIDDFGIVQDSFQLNCSGGGAGTGASF
jgi:hypothetical protein